MICAVVVAVVACWEVALLLLPMLPMALLFSASNVLLQSGLTKESMRRLQESSRTVVGSIVSIRTVAGLGAEDTFINVYSDCLAGAFK